MHARALACLCLLLFGREKQRLLCTLTDSVRPSLPRVRLCEIQERSGCFFVLVSTPLPWGEQQYDDDDGLGCEA